MGLCWVAKSLSKNQILQATLEAHFAFLLGRLSLGRVSSCYASLRTTNSSSCWIKKEKRGCHPDMGQENKKNLLHLKNRILHMIMLLFLLMTLLLKEWQKLLMIFLQILWLMKTRIITKICSKILMIGKILISIFEVQRN